MNYQLDSQIQSMIIIAKTFEQNCKMSALEDDGTISKDEAKALREITAATEKFIAKLNKIKK